ncbi:MAG: hypothetical protein ACON5A_05965 [Candidatus Comchoanobacterales bacterium]
MTPGRNRQIPYEERVKLFKQYANQGDFSRIIESYQYDPSEDKFYFETKLSKKYNADDQSGLDSVKERLDALIQSSNDGHQFDENDIYVNNIIQSIKNGFTLTNKNQIVFDIMEVIFNLDADSDNIKLEKKYQIKVFERLKQRFNLDGSLTDVVLEVAERKAKRAYAKKYPLRNTLLWIFGVFSFLFPKSKTKNYDRDFIQSKMGLLISESPDDINRISYVLDEKNNVVQADVLVLDQDLTIEKLSQFEPNIQRLSVSGLKDPVFKRLFEKNGTIDRTLLGMLDDGHFGDYISKLTLDNITNLSKDDLEIICKRLIEMPQKNSQRQLFEKNACFAFRYGQKDKESTIKRNILFKGNRNLAYAERIALSPKRGVTHDQSTELKEVIKDSDEHSFSCVFELYSELIPKEGQTPFDQALSRLRINSVNDAFKKELEDNFNSVLENRKNALSTSVKQQGQHHEVSLKKEWDGVKVSHNNLKAKTNTLVKVTGQLKENTDPNKVKTNKGLEKTNGGEHL